MRRLVLAAAMLAAWSPPAAAEEVTRTQYKAQVERICRENTEANDQILSGVRKKVRQGNLNAAGRQFTLVAGALRKTLRQLRTVPAPPSDQARLEKWLSQIGDEASFLQRIGKALKAEQRKAAQALSAKLVSGARLANATVMSFGFHYCRFEPTRYT